MKIIEFNEDDDVTILLKTKEHLRGDHMTRWSEMVKQFLPKNVRFIFLPTDVEVDALVKRSKTPEEETFFEHLEKRDRDAIYEYAKDLSRKIQMGEVDEDGEPVVKEDSYETRRLRRVNDAHGFHNWIERVIK